MAPKSQEMLRKQKAAKQRKLIILLVPVLVIAGAYNVMKFAKSGDESSSASASATSGAADTSAAPADTSATGQASTPPASGATAPAGALPAPGSATLIDSDVPPEAGHGQLLSFERFIAKNPFQQQVDDQQAAGEGDKPGEAGKGEGGQTPPGTDGSTEAPDEPNTAELTVNGVAESVLVGASFPVSDPVFKIVAVKGDTAKVGLVSGSFSTGVDTIDLNVGQTLTLVSQPDGIRYVIKLLSITHSTATVPDGTTATPTGSTTPTTDTGSTTVPSTTVPSTTVPGTTGADSGTTGIGYASAGG